jgi:predicted DNA-binding transcriptional regulator YafY
MTQEILEGTYQMKVDRLVSIIMILLDKKRIGARIAAASRSFREI